MKDYNKTEPNDPIWRFENFDSFLKEILKPVKPQTNAMTEREKAENVIKVIMSPLNSLLHKQR